MNCSFDGCDKPARTKGLCQTHYMRLWRRGDPSIVLPPGEPGDGRRKHPLYGAWAGMISRCHNPNHSSYARYGGAGVSVCDRWRQDFRAFLADMGERPEGMTLDRYPDAAGNYEPGNCRWATPAAQRANRTPEGDIRTRTAAAAAQKKRWDTWRSERAASALE